MQSLMKPATEGELQRTLADASASGHPIEVLGAGTKRTVGRGTQTAVSLTTTSLAGLKLYEPTELVMSARAGTPRARIEAELAAQGQMLAFEPIDLGPVLGAEPRAGTIGAVFATNLSGARRVAGGSARDHLLGVAGVTGNGVPFRSGGRVMKNVTGYDIARLLTGSWGTLAVLTEVTFKVLPVPEQLATILFFGLDDAIAIEALSMAMASPWEVTGAVHLQSVLARRLWHPDLRGERQSVTAIRLENFSKSVTYRTGRLIDELKPFGQAHIFDHAQSLAFWDELRQMSVLQGSTAPLWRISTAPQAGPRVVSDIARFMDCAAFYDWSGGLVWAEVLPAADAGAADIRRVIAAHGGHATLIRAETAVRAAVDVFQPLDQGLRDITTKIKAVFDPAGILNPGRMTPTF